MIRPSRLVIVLGLVAVLALALVTPAMADANFKFRFEVEGLPSGCSSSLSVTWSGWNNGTQQKNQNANVGTPVPVDPGSEFTFSFPSPVTCKDGSVYKLLSTSHSSPTTAGEAKDEVTITGTYGPACVPPSITTQPANVTVTEGGTASFGVVASGTNLSYQWRQNGTDIAGANSSSYTTPSLALADNGASFDVVVSGECGDAVTSAAATVTVTAACVPPSITTQPANVTVTEGGTASFGVVANGTNLSYQWRQNGTDIAGANSSSYTTPSLALADNGASFDVVVSGECGDAVTSAAATLAVNATPPPPPSPPADQPAAAVVLLPETGETPQAPVLLLPVTGNDAPQPGAWWPRFIHWLLGVLGL